MLFLLIGVILIIVTLISMLQDWDSDIIAFCITVVFVYWIFGIGAIGGICYADSCTDVADFLEFQDKIEYYQEIYPFRKHLSEEEILKALEYNRWIVEKQINDKSFAIGFFISNRIRDLKPIEPNKLFWLKVNE
jgi:hypothetical protein